MNGTHFQLQPMIKTTDARQAHDLSSLLPIDIRSSIKASSFNTNRTFDLSFLKIRCNRTLLWP